jgi:glycosyltransferase involved in cell wall biosynthesis
MNDNIKFPLVSIITPSYNCGEYIEKTIQSIKGQDYPNIQHIIVDGGSTDKTIDILKKYSNTISWISEHDDGMYDAINKGFELAKGEIFTYINADDYYDSNQILTRIVNQFINNDNIDFTYGHCTFIDHLGKFMYTYKAPKFFRKYALAFPRGFFAQPTCFWRKEVHRNFDSSLQYVADSKFFRQLCESYNGHRINLVIAKYTIRKDCLTFENLDAVRKEDNLIYKDKNIESPRIKFLLIDIFYRIIFLNFRTNIKRKILKYKGSPYL